MFVGLAASSSMIGIVFYPSICLIPSLARRRSSESKWSKDPCVRGRQEQVLFTWGRGVRGGTEGRIRKSFSGPGRNRRKKNRSQVGLDGRLGLMWGLNTDNWVDLEWGGGRYWGNLRMKGNRANKSVVAIEKSAGKLLTILKIIISKFLLSPLYQWCIWFQ